MNKKIRWYAAGVTLAGLLSLSACGAEKPARVTSVVSKQKRPVFPIETQVSTTAPETSVTTVETTEPPLPESTADLIGYLGTAGNLSGTSVIVSIFADDLRYSWNDGSETDAALRSENLASLKKAAEWLTAQCLEYGCEAEFVCDWEEDPELCCRVRFSEDMVRFDSVNYGIQRDYIVNEVDSAGIKEKYGADNMIYIFFFNTDYSNQIKPWSLTYQIDPMFDIEIINSFVRFKDFDVPPATYAHEILHCFGAHDLYYANDAIPQSFVDNCEATNSRDIMYTVNSGQEITVLLSELDAYYVGLTDDCPLVREWGLSKSQHVNIGSDEY